MSKKSVVTKTHGLSITAEVRSGSTRTPTVPPIISCFGSYRQNELSLESPLTHFTYSVNDGPLQNVVLPPFSDAAGYWDEYDRRLVKLDTDLCRAKDGRSLAFLFDLSDNISYSTVIPDLTPVSRPIGLPGSGLPTTEAPVYPYRLTGISGDGLLPQTGVFNNDATQISIPLPFSEVFPLGEDAYLDDYPRWYPKNTLVPENNIIRVFPSENVPAGNIDLYTALGGSDGVLEISSCVAVVPREYRCVSTAKIGAQLDALGGGGPILASVQSLDGDVVPMPLDDGGVELPYTMDFNPFLFSASGLVNTAPNREPNEFSSRAENMIWVCRYKKNDGPVKVIRWINNSYGMAPDDLWGAIKALFLDEVGRTAFVMAGFNTTWTPDRITMSGIGSDSSVSIVGINDTLQTSDRNPFAQDAQAIEVNDSQIQFAQNNAGIVWEENTITFYPVSLRGEVPFRDFYECLCQTETERNNGLPITIHSCAAIEPKDHIRVNTSIGLTNDEQNPAGLGISASFRLNDGEVKHFSFEYNQLAEGWRVILSYIMFLTEDPAVSLQPYNPSQIVPDDKINLLYFKILSDFNTGRNELHGCSGIESPLTQHSINPIPVTLIDGTQTINVVEIPDSIAYNATRVSNKLTFIRNKKAGYLDFFEILKLDPSVNEYDVYSSAGVPATLVKTSFGDDGNFPNDGDMFTQEQEYMNYRKPWVFKLTKTNGLNEPFDVVAVARTSNYVIADHDTGEILASGFGRTHPGIIPVIPENEGRLEHRFDMTQFGGSATFDLYFGLSWGNLSFTNGGGVYKRGPKEGELEIIEWYAENTERFHIYVDNTTVKLPNYLPPAWTDLGSLLSYTNMANPDISMWDVSNVVDMSYMFENAIGFNQDLSGWCVEKIGVEPTGFRKGASNWTLPKPVWGTCPANEVEYGILKFSLDAPTTEVDRGAFIHSYDSNADWKLYREGELIADSVSNSHSSFFFGNDGQSTRNNFELHINSNEVSLSGTDDWQAVQAVNITEFPTIITTFAVSFAKAEVTVPELLAPNFRRISFMGCRKFNQDISMWDTSNLTTTLNMFTNCVLFNSPLNDWDVSNVTSMGSMFDNCESFNQPLDKWDVSNVVDMSSMFRECDVFNQPLDKWDVSNVLYMDSMFFDVLHFNQDLSAWNVVNIPVEPGSFYRSSAYRANWTLPKPVWGTTGVVTGRPSKTQTF